MSRKHFDAREGEMTAEEMASFKKAIWRVLDAIEAYSSRKVNVLPPVSELFAEVNALVDPMDES